MARTWMTEYRTEHKRTPAQMARKAACMESTVTNLEADDDWRTVPTIAARVAHAYGMTAEQYNTMVLDKYRIDPHGKLPPPVNPRRKFVFTH